MLSLCYFIPRYVVLCRIFLCRGVLWKLRHLPMSSFAMPSSAMSCRLCKYVVFCNTILFIIIRFNIIHCSFLLCHAEPFSSILFLIILFYHFRYQFVLFFYVLNQIVLCSSSFWHPLPNRPPFVLFPAALYKIVLFSSSILKSVYQIILFSTSFFDVLYQIVKFPAVY